MAHIHCCLLIFCLLHLFIMFVVKKRNHIDANYVLFYTENITVIQFLTPVEILRPCSATTARNAFNLI